METPDDDRLVELVRELAACPPTTARRALRAARREAAPDEDPLATVARAMVLVRAETRR